MEEILPHIGILPNQLWPSVMTDGHAEKVFISQPHLRVLLEVFTQESRSPLHIHTHADRFFYIAKGEMTLVTAKTCTRIKEGQGTIIRADYPHGFFVPDHGAKLVSIALGSDVQESQSQLPLNICQVFAPLQGKMDQLHIFKHETRWKDLYSQFEVQTMQWVKQSMMDCLEKQKPLPFLLTPHKHAKVIPMQGWQTPRGFIFKVKGHSYSFSYHEDEGSEYINMNRVFTLPFAMNRSEKKIPVLK